MTVIREPPMPLTGRSVSNALPDKRAAYALTARRKKELSARRGRYSKAIWTKPDAVFPYMFPAKKAGTPLPDHTFVFKISLSA